MTKPTSPSPLARLVKRLLPAQPAPAPQPEEQPEGEQPEGEPTVKMYPRRFVSYGD